MIANVHASSLARAMTCSGHLFFTDLPQEPPSAAAEEGTTAAEYLERVLRSGVAQDLLDTHSSKGVPFTNDMKFYLLPLADKLLKEAQSKVLCEETINWTSLCGIELRGRYDVSYIKDGKLHIGDLKYGYGIVEVKNNWQLIGYAIGEVIRRKMSFDAIVLEIYQPRPHHEDGHIRQWEITYNELLAFKEQIEQKFLEIKNGDNKLNTSDNCKYCKAVTVCPALSKAAYNALEYSMEFVVDNISETELSRELDLVKRAEDLIKIKKDSIQQLAVNRIKSGKIIPNWVTETSYGNRTWKSNMSPKVIETLTGRKATEEIMLSPNELEKQGVPKDFINHMTERKFLGQKLTRKDTTELGNRIFNNKKET